MSSIVRFPSAESPIAPGIATHKPRLLVIGLTFCVDSMEAHVVDGARALGCQTEQFEARSFRGSDSTWQRAVQKIGQLMFREPERVFERRLIEAVERGQPELILVVLGSQLSPKTVQLLRSRTSAPIVCWCQDQMTTIGRQYLLGARYDAVFVKDRYMQELFSSMLRSSQFHYLPEACNPRMHRTLELTADDAQRYGCDVMLAGTLYYYRQEILAALDEFDLKVYGGRPGWLLDRLGSRHISGEVRGDFKVRAARAARIALNTLHYAEVNAINCRAFELAGIGAFQLIDHKPVLAEHFKPGEEIETFRNIDELVSKVRYFLANPERARSIAAAGQRRAHRDHTYEARLREIFSITLGRRVAQSS